MVRGAYAQARIQRMIRPTALITLSTFLVCAAASLAQTPAPPVTLSDTEQRTITSSKIGRRYDLFISSAGKLLHIKTVIPRALRPRRLAFPFDGVPPGQQHLFEAHAPGHHCQHRAIAGQGRDDSPRTRLLADPDSQVPGSGGGAPAFLDFLEHELIPFIDHTYRTNPSDRGLLGHSMGGEFALYALEQRPGLFQRIVAASPALVPRRQPDFHRRAPRSQCPACSGSPRSLGRKRR